MSHEESTLILGLMMAEATKNGRERREERHALWETATRSAMAELSRQESRAVARGEG